MAITRLNPEYADKSAFDSLYANQSTARGICIGSNWIAMQNVNGSNVHRLQISSDGSVQVWKSTDGGANWTKVKTL